jgi:hypothetical protein
VGASAAIAAEVAIGILLYAGPGLMRSLTTVLAAEGAALAAGLWSATPRAGPPLVDRLRRRWLFCLLTFMAAAFFGTSWSVVQDLGGGPVGQGVGLAVLAALPLYACGLVLGGMGTVAADDVTGRLPAPGAAAALGAALGFVLTGALLPRAPIPASLLVACLVLLSAGGMIYGVVLASRPVVHVRGIRHAAGGDVRVEDRLRLAGDEAARYLLECGHVRRRESLNGEGAVPWDVEVARSLLGETAAPVRILALGGGASALPRTIVGEWPHVAVDVLERNPAVVDLARAHFDTAPEEAPADRSADRTTDAAADQTTDAAAARVSLRTGNLEDLLAETRGPYDLVIVDTAALAPLGGVEGLSRSARAALLAAVGSRGSLVAGPLAADSSLVGSREGWRTTELRRVRAGAAEPEVVIVGRPVGAEPWSGTIGEFEVSNGERLEA